MRYFLSFFIISLLAIHSLPYLIKEQALIWLHKQGVAAPKLKSIEFEWLSGQIIIKDLQAHTLDTPALDVKELNLTIDYASLFDQRILIKDFTLIGFNSGVKQTKDAFYVGPIDINQFTSDDNSPDEDTEKSAWLLGVDQITVTDLSFNADVKPHLQNLTIEKASLQKFYQWQKDTQTLFDVTGTINDSPIAIATNSTPLADQKKATFEIKLNDFAIESVAGPFVAPLTGQLNVDLFVEVNMDQTKNVISATVDEKSSINLSTLNWKDQQQTVAISDVNWLGGVNASLVENKITQAEIEGKLSIQSVNLNSTTPSTEPTEAANDSVVQLGQLSWLGKVDTVFSNGELTQLAISDDLTLSQLALSQKDTLLSIAKLVLSKGKEPITIRLDKNIPQQIVIASSLNIDSLAMQQAKQKITADSFELLNNESLKISFKESLLSNITADPAISISGLAIDAGDSSLSTHNTHLSGPISIKLDQNILQEISLASALNIDQLAMQQAKQKIKMTSFKLLNKNPIQVTFVESLPNKLSANPELSINGLAINTPDAVISSNQTRLSGPLSISNLSKAPIINFNNTLNTGGLNVKYDNLIINSDALSVKAQNKALDLTKPAIKNIQLSSNNFSLTNAKSAFNIASFSKLIIKNGQFSPASSSLGSLSVNKLSIAKDKSKNTLTQIDQLNINTLKLAKNHLAINNVQLKNSTTTAQIDAKGQLLLIEKLEKALASNSKSPAKAEKQSKPFSYAINKITMTGNNIIAIDDKSVDPWFKSKVNLNGVNITSLSSAPSSLVSYDINAVINDSAKVKANGKITPFASSKSGDWKLTLSSLSMPVISPYAGKFSGYFLDSGKLSIDSSGSIAKNVIKGKNKINIQQLAVRSAESDATSKTNSTLSMPLDVAISVLENDNGNIDLSVPITGSVDDPDFGYSSVMGIIAKKGLKQAAFGFLSKAIQPYGALITIANTAIKAKQSGSFINLAPVNFDAGQETINPEMKGYLKKIAKLMKERKKLKLKICAIGVALDRDTLSTDLTEKNTLSKEPLTPKDLTKLINNTVQALATNRGELVLKELQALKVKKDRLFVCFAKTNFKNKKLKPTVSLGL